MTLEPADAAAPRYRAGDVIAGKYQLSRLLGAGGMGAVWAAVNLQLEATVAIKLLLRAGAERELWTLRLKQEARATARLNHPAIVRVFDVGESERGEAFIVMELLNGQSLGARLANIGPMPAMEAVQLLLPVADALAVAHAKGIVHRDLKPDNIILVEEDGRLSPKLVDFGIAKLAAPPEGHAPLTQANTVLGSPDYMSPEQARGRHDVDHRSDVWSFCVVLYEMMSGRTPFGGPNYNALLRSIIEDDPPPLDAACDGELWAILRRGLEKEPSKRFESMRALGRELAIWSLRRGVTEDVAGRSLEAKWLARASDGGTPRERPSVVGIDDRADVAPERNPTPEPAPAVERARASAASVRSRARPIFIGVIAAGGVIAAIVLRTPERPPPLESRVVVTPPKPPPHTPAAPADAQISVPVAQATTAAASASVPVPNAPVSVFARPAPTSASSAARSAARDVMAPPARSAAPTPEPSTGPSPPRASDLLAPY